MKTYIYTLSHPITNEVRYVGKTVNPKQRKHNHSNIARDKGTHKRNWINLLKTQKLRPLFEIIDEVDSDWKFWEKYWISQFKVWGFTLCNHTLGGDGLETGNQTSFKKGQIPWNKGLTHSEETKNILRSLVLGKPSLKKIKVNQYDLNDNLICTYNSITEAAKKISGSEGKICACCNNKRNKHKNFKWKYYDNRNIRKNA
jgi:hypothetical protein